MTQRKPNPYFVRASATSAQNMHPLADYAAKELKYKRVITVADDFAFGYEQMGGFQRVFEDAGGRVVKKLWPPLVTPDYTPYLAQISGVDAVVAGLRRLQSAEVHEAVQGRRAQAARARRRHRRATMRC